MMLVVTVFVESVVRAPIVVRQKVQLFETHAKPDSFSRRSSLSWSLERPVLPLTFGTSRILGENRENGLGIRGDQATLQRLSGYILY